MNAGQRRADPNCPACGGRGLVHESFGGVNRQTQCRRPGCLEYTGPRTAQDAVRDAEARVAQAEAQLAAAQAALLVAQGAAAAACKACGGARVVLLAGAQYPCTVCTPAKAACTLCKGAGMVDVGAGVSMMCPHGCKKTPVQP